MKNYFTKLGTYALDYIAAMWVGILVLFIALYPIELIVELTPLAERIVRASLCTVGTTVWLFISAHRIGYKSKAFKFPTVIAALLTLFVLQQVLSVVTDYVIYIAGATNDLAEAVRFGNRVTGLEAPGYVKYLCLLALDLLLFIPAVLTGEYLGARKRQKDRDALIGRKEVV